MKNSRRNRLKAEKARQKAEAPKSKVELELTHQLFVLDNWVIKCSPMVKQFACAYIAKNCLDYKPGNTYVEDYNNVVFAKIDGTSANKRLGDVYPNDVSSAVTSDNIYKEFEVLKGIAGTV